jgi:hypothetical protein
VQRTGASRFAQRQVERPRRLAPVADLCVRRQQSRSPSVQSPTMKTLITVTVLAVAAIFTFAQDAASPVAVSVLGRTNDPAGRPFVSVQVTNAAEAPCTFYYFAVVPSGAHWSHAHTQYGGAGWAGAGRSAGAGSAHHLRAGSATNFVVLVPPGEERWRVQVRFKGGAGRERYTSTSDILETER